MSAHELYVVSEGLYGPIKIGHSQNSSARLSALQTGNSRSLVIALRYRMTKDQALEAERMLHEELEEYSLEGEWFDLGEVFISEYLLDFLRSNGIEAIP